MARIESVVKGDIIIERVAGRNRMIPVKKVEHNTCSKPSVHINNNACYDWGTHVRIAEGEGTLGDLEMEVSGMGDLEEDWKAVGTVRVDENGVNEDDMDAAMERIIAITNQLVKH
jgi:hypothetical protein